ncbi:hypothetical protein ACJJTC_016292 [Scirpophaga incertulas]
MENKNETVKLCYTVHKYSSYSANYIPENIMVNNPSDQLSRWFTDSTTSSQYIMLKLKSPSIVETIKFGKYIKAHVSDLKKFQIFGGTDENNMSLLLSAGLRKDNIAEVFRVRHRSMEGLYLPVNYIKIVPLQSWGPAYNYTIWYVELQGKNQEQFINEAVDTINLRKEEEAVRILLKHLRRRRYKDAFEALSRESGVQLEGPLQTRLWNALVENGDFKLAEEIFEEAIAQGEVEWYLSWQPYLPRWRQMSACSAQVEARLSCADEAPAPRAHVDDVLSVDRDPSPGPAANDGGDTNIEECDVSCCNRPGPRGGHQLVVDSQTGTLYLFGGWNGHEDLDDLWAYDTRAEKWQLLCASSSSVGGPKPRSCHKMVFDPKRRRLYLLGRYLENAQRLPENMMSELYAYDVAGGAWALLSPDTAAEGGPRLVFDHQMCIDPDTSTVYVFGGRVLPATPDEVARPLYSGLYAYYINTNTWQQLLDDQYVGPDPAPLPRVSHSMLFHPVQRRLYIFAGQRNKEHLVDLWWWDVATGERCAVCAAQGGGPPPAAGFTQRATLDPDTDEMFVLSVSAPPRPPPPAAGFTQRATLDPDTDEMFVLSVSAPPRPPPPAAGFTQRATLDPDTDEMFVLSVSAPPRPPPPAAGFTQRATLDPDTDEMFVLSVSAPPRPPPPAAGFTQRATLDPDTDEMFVLSVSAPPRPPPPAAGFTQRATLDPDTDEMFVLSVSAPPPPPPPAAGFTQRATLDPRHGRDVRAVGECAAPPPAPRRRLHAARHAGPRHGRDVRAVGECAAPPPAAGFTQRATLDPDTDEMFVLSGMSKEKDRRVYNTLWAFSLRRMTWACVYRNERVSAHEPRPRFAHQLVYDPATKVHYLFGGNPGNQSSPRLRLDDLWSLRLERAGAERVWHEARAALREAAYRALAAARPAAALRYLRTELRGATDPADPAQVRCRPTTPRSERPAAALRYLRTELRGATDPADPAQVRCRPTTPRSERPAAALRYLRTELRGATDPADPAQEARFQKLATVLFSAGPERARAAAPAPALCPRRARALQRRRAAAAARPRRDSLRAHLAAVLGAEDAAPEPLEPFEEVQLPAAAPDTWDVAEAAPDADAGADDADADADAERGERDYEWSARADRIHLYDELCRYFRPSAVAPRASVPDLVAL